MKNNKNMFSHKFPFQWSFKKTSKKFRFPGKNWKWETAYRDSYTNYFFGNFHNSSFFSDFSKKKCKNLAPFPLRKWGNVFVIFFFLRNIFRNSRPKFGKRVIIFKKTINNSNIWYQNYRFPRRAFRFPSKVDVSQL